MKTDNIIQTKSFAFAIRMVNACKYLQNNKKEFVLSKQMLKSGTCVGVNVEEAIGAQSKPDFVTKLAIAYKEARETNYWIRLIKATDYFATNPANSLLADAEELCRIIGKIQISTKNSQQNK